VRDTVCGVVTCEAAHTDSRDARGWGEGSTGLAQLYEGDVFRCGTLLTAAEGVWKGTVLQPACMHVVLCASLVAVTQHI
jgi:hypothetical protein